MDWKPQPTQDGTFTFYSPEFGEHFHSTAGARLEAEEKFVKPCRLAQKAPIQTHLTLIDICYGLGYNSAAAFTAIQTANPDCHITLIALELDVTVTQAAIAHHLLADWSPDAIALLVALAQTRQFHSECCHAQLLLGDARQTLRSVCDRQIQADAILLDPFSPNQCPSLWTVEFLALVAQCLKPDGILATYSCAASARAALQLAGLTLGSTPGVGRRSPGTVASFSPLSDYSLSPQEIEHLQTRAAIPYRDPTLADPAEQIRDRRRQEQATSHLESTSQWKKRWQGKEVMGFGPSLDLYCH
jgi:tRNA U34 5-methylaminomethyl-2-thiouridine-forming methyltransferase MnmC